MKIKEVYKEYSIPPNLVEHMLRVTKVALAICNNWTGTKLDTIEIKKSALVHDLGNLVRFDFDKHSEFLGSEIKNVNTWRERQKDIINKYGNDDHEATRLMLKELGFSDDSIEVVSSKSFINSIEVLNSNNWNLKILLYSDMRVSPSEIVSLEDRLSEVIVRRFDLSSRPDIDDLRNSIREVEKQIQSNVSISLDSINEKSAQVDDNELLNTDI